MELAELKNVDFNLKDFCMDIVKYQNFKPKYAIPNIRTNYKEATVRNLFSAGVSYIKFGKKSRIASKKFYGYIDEHIKNFVQPLRPSASQKRNFKNKEKMYQSETAIHPAKLAVLQIKEESKNAKMYGVMIEENVKVFFSKLDANTFLNGVKFAGKKGELVEIKKIGK